MEFASFSFQGFQSGRYTSNPEICDRIIQEMNAFYQKYGRLPHQIILGWGTYLTLCITVSDFHGQTSIGGVIKLTEFEGCQIVLDPGYEFRIACVPFEDVFESATKSFFDNKKNADKSDSTGVA